MPPLGGVADYPQDLLAREPPPPYAGEGSFALWHFSEDSRLSAFEPHVPVTAPESRPLVWAVDTRHAPLYWFPRDCPRGCIWATSRTSPDDRQRFFDQTAAGRIHVVEGAWLRAIAGCTLFAYRLPTESFRPHDVGGYWISEARVEPDDRVTVDDLLGRHAEAGIELRITPSLWAFWDQVVGSTVEFSGMRLRNATGRRPA